MDRPDLYVYPLRNPQVVDGDTVIADIDLGFGLELNLGSGSKRMGRSVRMRGYDAPEIDTDRGKTARDVLADLLSGEDVVLHSVELGKYGRVLGDLYYRDPDMSPYTINQQMVRWGYVKPDADAVDPAGLSADLIALNESPPYQLEWLPRIGPSTAEKIVNRRPYDQVTDLTDVSGVGETTLRDIEPFLTVESS